MRPLPSESNRAVKIVCSLLAAVCAASIAAAEPRNYPPLTLPDTSSWGKNIQRTMRLLATSTPEQRNTVRILFYGQSITEQRWSKMVEDDLRRRFPNANLLVENRALGGFSSQLLVKTAETDLYPFQPDLLIFHVYGAHDKYEDIIRRTRERSTAEILMQNDHVTKPADLSEETDPAKLPPAGHHWDAFMNQNWLPSLAKKYGAELCDQRSLWKSYLKEHKLEPKDLLRDAVHLNAHGEWLMARCVNAWLRYDPKLGPPAAEQWVKTHTVGSDVHWENGRLTLAFEGSRVDALCRPGPAGDVDVRIDGRKPSEMADAWGFTRALAHPEGKWPIKWPVVAPIGSEKQLVQETWTMRVVKEGDTLFKFSVEGSVTGPDGEGRSDQRFVSNSKRVVIETNAWNVTYVMNIAGIKPMPDTFQAQWKAELRGGDRLSFPGAPAARGDVAVTLAQGLANEKHTLELAGPGDASIRALRVYSPPLKPLAR